MHPDGGRSVTTAAAVTLPCGPSGPPEGWTPLAFDGTAPSPLVWGDLRGHPANAPFFSRTVDAWRQSAGEAVRTDLSALAAFASALDPALDPDLIIAHPSRTGSTLLAGLAAAESGSVLVSEPRIMLDLLDHHLAGTLGAPIGPVLQAVVRSQGRRRPDEQRYVFKLSSQATRFLPDIRRAFPRTPILWIQRPPAEIVESNLGRPAGGHPDRPDDVTAWVLRRITLAFLGAMAFVDHDVKVLDYADLRDPDWPDLARRLGMAPTRETLARMQAIAGRDSRSGARFVPRDRAPLPAAVAAIVRETLDPIYAALRDRHAAMLGAQPAQAASHNRSI